MPEVVFIKCRRTNTGFVSTTSAVEFVTGQILAVKGLLTLFCPDWQGAVDLKR
jgi:hypothetical protein